jgi:hypothetical protein
VQLRTDMFLPPLLSALIVSLTIGKGGPARLGRGLFDYELFPDGRSKCALANLLGSFERHRGYLEAPLDSIFYTVLATLCAHLERGVDRLEHDGTLEHDHRLLVLGASPAKDFLGKLNHSRKELFDLRIAAVRAPFSAAPMHG